MSKTSILWLTLITVKSFYIVINVKFINTNTISNKYKPSTVFGEFQINVFLNLYNLLHNLNIEIVNIDEYYYFKNRRWDLVFSNGLILKLPSKNMMGSIKIYKQLLDNESLSNTKIIDLRVINQIIMTNKSE